MKKKPPYKVIISERARQMLVNHVLFLSRKNASAARETKNRLMESIRSLSDMPERFPFLEGEFIPFNKYHKRFVENQYLILYQIKDQTVYVDYIIDCRQDYGWLIR
jgi:plasmid stabilization system protein ParE